MGIRDGYGGDGYGGDGYGGDGYGWGGYGRERQRLGTATASVAPQSWGGPPRWLAAGRTGTLSASLTPRGWWRGRKAADAQRIGVYGVQPKAPG